MRQDRPPYIFAHDVWRQPHIKRGDRPWCCRR
nr:MAG TPA: hypothetical protein [Caudoviricetes sp.]